MGIIAILINGKPLDLPTDFTVEKEFETSLFNRELNKRDFTYPSTLPLTDANNALLGLISNLATETKVSEFPADMYLNDVYYNLVTVKVLGVSTIDNTIEISIIGTYGTFARLVGDKKLADLYLDGDRLIGTTDTVATGLGTVHWAPPGFLFEHTFNFYLHKSTAYDHMKDVATNIIEADYCFYPSMDTKQNLPGLNEGCVNYINLWDWGTDTFCIPPIELYRATMRSEISVRHFSVPYFKVLYVLRKCFEEHGFTVTGDIFTEPGRKQKATLHNTAAFNRYRVDTTLPRTSPHRGEATTYDSYIYDESNVIHPQDHMPDIGVVDFVNELAKAWNLDYRIDLKLMTVDIVQLKYFSLTAQKTDLSARTSPLYQILMDQNEMEAGYKLGYEWDDANSYTTGKLKDTLEDLTVLDTFNTVADLRAYSGPVEAFTIAWVANENAWYQFGGTDWFFYSYNFQPKQSKEDGENPVEVNTKFNPVPTSLEYILRSFEGVSDIELDARNQYLPVTNIGIKGKSLLQMHHPKVYTEQNVIYIENVYVLAVQDSDDIRILPHLCYYRDFQPNLGGTTTPYGSISSLSPIGSTMGPENFYLAAPNGTGTYFTQWEDWLNLLKNSFPVKYEVLKNTITDDTTEYQSMIIRIHGQDYLLRKENTPLPFPTVSTMELIRI